jgi:tRNA(Ile2) C34 agmatinyltransferase TiaS
MLESRNDEASQEATLEELARKAQLPCPRCGGRMMGSGAEGDIACFACGHRIYRWAPESQPPPRHRASSGGRSLD